MNCRSCHSDLLTDANFCHECGEKVHMNRLSVRGFFKKFVEHFLDYDNKLFKTFRHLFTQPEAVIDSYVQGNRKRYVNVFGYLSISLTLIAIQIFVLRKFYPELLIAENAQSTGLEGLDNMNNAIFDYQGAMVILATPFAALMSRLTFLKNKKYNWAEHMVINIYPSAQFYIIWFFCTFIIIGLKISFQLASLFPLPLLFIYMVHIFRRIYDISWGRAVYKTIIYFILYGIMMTILFFIIGLSIVLYLYMTGQIDASQL